MTSPSSMLHAMLGESGEADAPRRTLALLRLTLIPVIALGEHLHPHPMDRPASFVPTLAAAALYAGLTVWRPFALPAWMCAALDVGFICALTYETGGAFSELRRLFVVLPIGAVFVLRPRVTVLASLAAVLAYITVSLHHPGTSEAADVREVIYFSLSLTWIGVTTVWLTVILARRQRRIAQLVTHRGQIVAQALDAEERERRRLADALHDGLLQNLLAARQDVDEGAAGDRRGLRRAAATLDATTSQLRQTVLDLYPPALSPGSLPAVLRTLADKQARRGGFQATVHVDPEATGVDDHLVFSLVRELLTNTAKHASAGRALVNVAAADEHLMIDVVDDGCGVDEHRQRAALRDGHIGLASTAERIAALGGSFDFVSEPDLGTHARVQVPMNRERRRVQRSRDLSSSSSSMPLAQTA